VLIKNKYSLINSMSFNYMYLFYCFIVFSYINRLFYNAIYRLVNLISNIDLYHNIEKCFPILYNCEVNTTSKFK